MLAAALVLGGCNTGKLMDINDPVNASAVSGESLQVALRGIYDNLEFRRGSEEITQAQLEEEMRQRARDFTESLDVDDISPEEAWRFAEVFRTAEDWKSAARLYERAVAAAQTEDRRVNDTLQLARCYAHLGRIKESLSLAKKSFDAPPGDKGAILPAILLEIAPAAVDKGHDVELARLLAAACEQHLMVEVDARTVPGKAFLVARRHHIREALDWASHLLAKEGKVAEAAAVDRRRRTILELLPRFEPSK